jgi:aspartate aminotransferase
VPDEIKEAAKDSIDGNYSFYSPVAGFKDVREGIASKLTKENKLDVKFDQVVISTGGEAGNCQSFIGSSQSW